MTEDILNLYTKCSQCPRKCQIDRTQNKKSFCGEGDSLKIALACLHFGEEPLITVFGGSGTIFFTGCTLRCAFCQNYQISQHGMGKDVSAEEFADMCLKLENLGAENINLVTGSHNIPLIAQGLKIAKEKGLKIPVAWNSSAYESTESLELLKGLVDIYLPDLKTLNPLMSEELFKAKDYPAVAKKSIRWMMENAPCKIKEVKDKKTGQIKEKMFSGVIIRHLLLPGRMEDTLLTLDWLKIHADSRAVISLMSQYTPVKFNEDKKHLEARNKSLSSFQNRFVNEEEDKILRKKIDEYAFEYMFYQELNTDDEWLPDFERTQPFSNALAKVVWHWKYGAIDSI